MSRRTLPALLAALLLAGSATAQAQVFKPRGKSKPAAPAPKAKPKAPTKAKPAPPPADDDSEDDQATDDDDAPRKRPGRHPRGDDDVTVIVSD